MFLIKQNDTSPSIRYALSPASVNILGATVRFHMSGDDVLEVDKLAVIEQVSPPIVRFDWEAGDTAIAGSKKAEFEITYLNGKVETYPNDGFIPIKVTPELA